MAQSRRIKLATVTSGLTLAGGICLLAVVFYNQPTPDASEFSRPVEVIAANDASDHQDVWLQLSDNEDPKGKRLPRVVGHGANSDGESADDDPPTERNIEPEFEMPEWSRVFNADGSLKDELNREGKKRPDGVSDFVDLYRGVSARFTREILSNGIATDMSALLNDEVLSNQILYNGPVSPAHDLGNAWMMTSRSGKGGMRIFTAVERLTSGQATYVEFEFNQKPVRLGSGTPWWQLQGERSDDDLLVKMNFGAGKLESVEIAFWDDAGFEPIQSLPGIWRSGCVERSFIIYCLGPPQIDPPSGEGFEVWDENFTILETTEPDQFVELALDIGEIYSKQVSFGGFIVRTPQDVAMDWFPGSNQQVANLFQSYGKGLGSE